MKYREFGSTGFKVSALGFGAMRLPQIAFIPLSVNIKKSVKLMRNAIDQGVNYFDTAYSYGFGASEKALGMTLQDGYRSKVHVTTKLFMPFVRKGEDFDKMLENQMNKLQTDYLDTYLFHGLNAGYFKKMQELNLMEKMLKAQKEGKIKYIGFSFHDTLPVFKDIVDYYDWDVVQIQYNYMDTAVQATEEGLKYAASKNMAIVIMEPVKGGMLANPPKEAQEVMKKSKVQRSAVDWALQYLWNLPEVSVIISGMGNQKMLDENCRSADTSGIYSLSSDDMDTIKQLVAIYKKNILVPCTACQYCMTCPQGVNIPQNFAILNNSNTEKMRLMAWMLKRSYKKLADRPEKLNAQKSNGNASLCTDCKVCVEKCPQKINIPEELKKVRLVIENKQKMEKVFG